MMYASFGYTGIVARWLVLSSSLDEGGLLFDAYRFIGGEQTKIKCVCSKRTHNVKYVFSLVNCYL